MQMPAAIWLPIVRYLGFWDVPRWVLAGSPDSGFWLLDSPFDDVADDYSLFFRVRFAGGELEAALAAFQARGSHEETDVDEFIAVLDIQFDATRRVSLMRQPQG